MFYAFIFYMLILSIRSGTLENVVIFIAYPHIAILTFFTIFLHVVNSIRVNEQGKKLIISHKSIEILIWFY